MANNTFDLIGSVTYSCYELGLARTPYAEMSGEQQEAYDALVECDRRLGTILDLVHEHEVEGLTDLRNAQQSRRPTPEEVDQLVTITIENPQTHDRGVVTGLPLDLLEDASVDRRVIPYSAGWLVWPEYVIAAGSEVTTAPARQVR